MKILRFSLIFFFLFLTSIFIWAKTYISKEPPTKNLPHLADTNNIKADLHFLTKECRYTSFHRNKNYHTPADTFETMNFTKIGLVIDEVYRAVDKIK